MNLLALDTSTDQMSVAVSRVLDGQTQLWQHNGPGGALTSANLLPVIERLMAQAGLRYEDLQAIAFGQGPGAFTGLRTACAVAQGLAFGAGIPVLPVDTLLTVAEAARFQHAPEQGSWRVLALLDARMDELYAAHCEFANGVWSRHGDDQLLRPEAVRALASEALAGNVFAAYGERLAVPPELPRWPALPTASAMLRLAPTLLAAGHAVAAEHALPRYIRDKVAQTTQERAATKAASANAP